MKACEILGYSKANPVDENKVNEIYQSIKENGWQGAPILTWGNCLITGSHRLAAIEKIYEDGGNLSFECAEDVTDIIEEKLASGEMDKYDIFNNLDYLREIFAGTWVERYKDQLEEW